MIAIWIELKDIQGLDELCSVLYAEEIFIFEKMALFFINKILKINIISPFMLKLL